MQRRKTKLIYCRVHLLSSTRYSYKARYTASFNLIFPLHVDKHLACYVSRTDERFRLKSVKIHRFHDRSQCSCYRLNEHITADLFDKAFDLSCRRRYPTRLVDIGVFVIVVVVVVVVPVNVIKRANGIATNGRSVIIQLGGTICRYNPNLSKVDSLHKTGRNFYNKQQQQRRHQRRAALATESQFQTRRCACCGIEHCNLITKMDRPSK